MGRFVWHDLKTVDLGGARAFYGELCGWQFDELRLGGVTVLAIRVGERRVGAMMPEKEIPSSHWMPHLAVEDTDAACARVTELGGKVCVPPMPIPRLGRFAVVDDPQGAPFSILRRPDGTPPPPDPDGEGLFAWDPADHSARVAVDAQQGVTVPPTSDPSGASGAWVRKFNGPYNVKWFGATGDGVADDSGAFVAALAFLKGIAGNGDIFYEASPRLFIPAGHSPDILRGDERFVNFVKEFDDSGKEIAAICHGAQLLMAARVVEGRTLTAWKTVQRDLELIPNVNVRDEPVVRDANWITSRQPDDLDAFSNAILEDLKRGRTGRAEETGAGLQA